LKFNGLVLNFMVCGASATHVLIALPL